MDVLKEIKGILVFALKQFPLLVFVLFAIYPVWAYYGEFYGMILLVIITYFLYFILFYLHQKNLLFKRDHILINMGIILLFAVVLIVPQLFVINTIECEAQDAIDEYSLLADEIFKDDTLGICWSLTGAYRGDYSSGFHVKDSVIPARNLAEFCVKPFYAPFIYYFIHEFYNEDYGYGKAALLTRTGNCGEFSQAVVYMINATMGLPTRSVHFKGHDHEFPEVFVNDDWYVFDRTFKTTEFPVKSEDYAGYIEDKDEDFSKCISDIKQVKSDISLLDEHGFNTTTIEVQLAYWDNMTFGDVFITLYVMDNNATMPVLNRKHPDDNGHCNFSVRSDIRYLIFAEKSSLFSKYKGFKDLFAANRTEFMNVSLYEVPC
ncbi:transglutaminase domain-containing protein [Methanoplanus endosymbiosus]|uniref:Transglutaminase domain-containing protein n=1 Tax=Methanoplanus endosymbiosus TaxID=33865 RepID=A0A9E7PMJ7_9EURY|nr:transglutaminase domain-containing protein [Methanoplanus endosymbiosus]UUX92978.1 transglutaminase domain-containing protein [Methanoplanus endosymbiosus]